MPDLAPDKNLPRPFTSPGCDPTLDPKRIASAPTDQLQAAAAARVGRTR